jgi:hypothetical protein
LVRVAEAPILGSMGPTPLRARPILALALVACIAGCRESAPSSDSSRPSASSAPDPSVDPHAMDEPETMKPETSDTEIAILAGGCFWGMEELIRQQPGVLDIHDPTTKNRQGNEVGTQYRSALFYTSEDQKAEAGRAIVRAQESGRWKQPITTEVAAASKWWQAEAYQQDYLQKHPGGYTCHYIRD